MKTRYLSLALGACMLAACNAPATNTESISSLTTEAVNAEVLQGDILWSARMPHRWNGTLLVHSRGWSPVAGQPAPASAQVEAALLAQGYALAGSNYGSGGWALAEAVPAQETVITEFSRRFGKPQRTIAFGYSMGGLVTTALSERRNPVIDGGISLCSSMGGSLGMMNMGLDGAFVFRTLVAPCSAIQLVNIDDDLQNGALVRAVVEEAVTTPEGRARIALAGVLAGIPGWTRADMPQPTSEDAEAQFEQIIGSFPGGVFLPRTEQEQRAGGNFSWNADIDYTALLEGSGRREMVAQMYRTAGISLDADLATLEAASRITADPQAVQYMRINYTPFAQPRVPLLGIQAFGDGITSPSLQRAYADYAPTAMMDSQYVERAGHCVFDEAETLAAIRHMETRLDTGQWPDRAPPFADHEPAPMLRPCFQGKVCR